MKKNSWIISESISIIDGHDEDIMDCLLELLKNTGRVISTDVIKNDILEHNDIENSSLNEYVDVPHTKTSGVEDLCVSVAVVPNRKIYILIAYNSVSPRCLKYLAGLVNMFLDCEKCRSILQAKDNSSILEDIQTHMKTYGISC